MPTAREMKTDLMVQQVSQHWAEDGQSSLPSFDPGLLLLNILPALPNPGALERHILTRGQSPI